MDSNLLKGILMINGYSVSKLVDEMEENGVKISKSSFYKKLREENEFTAREIKTITEIIGLSQDEVYSIFFKELVS